MDPRKPVQPCKAQQPSLGNQSQMEMTMTFGPRDLPARVIITFDIGFKASATKMVE